jgi:hypothetical protein
MRIATVLILGALVLPFASPTAEAQSFVWAKQFGLTGTCTAAPESIAVDSAGSGYVTGLFCQTADFDPGPGTFLLAAGAQDAYVLKLDSAGSFVWARALGSGTGNDAGHSIAIDAAGNVLVTGSFQATADFDPGPGTFPLTAAGSIDAFVVKLDPSGSLVWAKQLGGTSAESGLGIAVDPVGGVVTSGVFSGTVDFDPGLNMFNITSAGLDDAFIVKLNSSGDLLWARRMGGTSSERATAVDLDSQAPYLVGSFSGTADFDPGPGTFNLTATGTSDAFVVKLDSGGNFVWARQLGGSSTSNPNDHAYDVAVDALGIVYTVGEFSGTADFDPGPGTFNLTATGSAAFISKLSAGGNFLWAKQLGGAATPGPVARSVAFQNGQVFTVGWFGSSGDFDPGAGTFNLATSGGDEVFVSQLDGSGNFLWAGRLGTCPTCGSPGNDRAFGVAVSPSENIYTTGTFTGVTDFDPGSLDFNLTSSGFASDSFVSRLSPEKLGGTVPDLRVRKSGTTDIRLDWGVSCSQGMPAYGVYEGQLGDFTSHTARGCFFGIVTNFTLTPFSGNRYYLVVPNDDFDEGSYGRNSAGVERPQGMGNCMSQAPTLGCP